MQMVQFNDWCVSADGQVGNHFHRVMTGQAGNLAAGVQATAAVVPGHYASEEHVARALRRLGKPAAAALIEGKLPTTKAIRSGDLGEIYATEWIDAHSGGYHAPIKRLRWKDHRNMAMRGEDVIGMLQDPQTKLLRFLKTEAKSRVTLTAQVVAEARASLDRDGGLLTQRATKQSPGCDPESRACMHLVYCNLVLTLGVFTIAPCDFARCLRPVDFRSGSG